MSLNRKAFLSFTVALLIMTTARLPAPISEEPTPTPSQKHATKARPQNAETVKAAVKKTASMTDQSVQVVFTETTRASLMHLRTYVETAEKIPFAPKSDVKPDEVTERLRQVLSNRFRNVSISERFGNRLGDGLVMVFDLQAHVGMTSGEKNTVSIVGTFKDGSGKALQTITAAGSTTVPYPAWRTHFPEAFSAALSEFSQKLGNYRQ
jgi:hypothetical protein